MKDSAERKRESEEREVWETTISISVIKATLTLKVEGQTVEGWKAEAAAR